MARVRNGFVPASRRQVFERIRHLASLTMPFVNLPDTHKSRWGDELTAEKMKECIWLRPEAVAQSGFLEWTAGDRLRHSKFVGLREDKGARQVVKERRERKPKEEQQDRSRTITHFSGYPNIPGFDAVSAGNTSRTEQ